MCEKQKEREDRVLLVRSLILAFITSVTNKEALLIAQVLPSTAEVTLPIENSAKEITWPRN
jgi:hypothetical protein